MKALIVYIFQCGCLRDKAFSRFQTQGKDSTCELFASPAGGTPIALNVFLGTIIELLGWEAAVSILAMPMICLRFILQNEKCAYCTEK